MIKISFTLIFRIVGPDKITICSYCCFSFDNIFVNTIYKKVIFMPSLLTGSYIVGLKIVYPNANFSFR